MGVVGAVNPFSPNNSSTEPKTGRENPHKYTVDPTLTYTMKFRRCVRARDGKRHTDDRSQLPQITQIIYWILLFYFFALALFSTRLVCYALFHFFFATAHFSYLLYFFFFVAFFAHFFLLYFSSFSRARVVFRLIIFFFLLLLLRPFSHAPPRLLIARNRCDFAHLYVFFLFYLPLMCLLVPFLREQLDYCD